MAIRVTPQQFLVNKHGKPQAVILSLADFRRLVRLAAVEAGDLPTPKLDRTVAQARARFRKGQVIPWEQIKRGLK